MLLFVNGDNQRFSKFARRCGSEREITFANGIKISIPLSVETAGVTGSGPAW